MRSFFTTLVLLVVSLHLWGQEDVTGNFDPMINVHKVAVIVDWSEVKIANLTESEWLETRQNENPRMDAKIELEKQLKPILIQKLIPNANKHLDRKDLYLVRHETTNVTLKVIPLSIKKNGSNTCRFQLINKEGVFYSFVLSCNSGLLGSMANLWADAFENTGEELGRFLKKELKKSIKKKK